MYYSSAAPQHNIIELPCTGDESAILDCFRPQHEMLHGYPCSLNNDANIFCESTYKEI